MPGIPVGCSTWCGYASRNPLGERRALLRRQLLQPDDVGPGLAQHVDQPGRAGQPGPDVVRHHGQQRPARPAGRDCALGISFDHRADATLTALFGVAAPRKGDNAPARRRIQDRPGAGESTMANATLTGAAQPKVELQDRLRTFLADLRHALRTINLTGLAAQVSYSLIFAMPSILLIVAVVALYIDSQTGFAISDEVKALVIGTLPPSVQPVVAGLIDESMTRAREGPSTVSAFVAIAVALFAAGNGLGELATAFDRAAEIDDPRPAWQKRFIFTASAVLIGLVLVVAFTFYVWGGDLIAALAQRYHLAGDWERGWLALQGPVIVLLVFAGTTLLYMTSSGRYRFRETAPGAAVATGLWLAIVKGFQLYLQVANPGTAYGAASSVLVFLVFLYLTSMGLIIGAMCAAVIVRESRERGLLQPAVPALARSASAADAGESPEAYGGG